MSDNNEKENCIFCKIVAGEIPSVDIYEDEKVKAFLDINPVTYGHTLVIPKEHFPFMPDLPDDITGYVFKVAKHLMNDIKKAYSADFVTLVVVGIDVPHFHIHLIPRKQGDGIANFWPTTTYQEGDMEKEAERIRSYISPFKIEK
ncbi:MAG: HIT family protein [Candidatus Paceibacterota bacterium]